MKKILVLVMAGVMSIAALGVGYAMWSSTITMVGTVDTGSVDIEWSGPEVWDDESEEVGLQRDGPMDPDLTGEIKDVGKCDARYAPFGTDGAIDRSTMLISVGNAYPSYDCFIKFDVHYNGTVPGHSHVTPLQPASPIQPLPASALHWDCWFTPNVTPAVAPIPVPDITYLDRKQLHQSDRLDCVLRIHFTNKDPITMLTKYGFGWTIVANQYNEDPL